MEFIKRLQSPTPDFHKKLRNMALIVSGIAGALIAATEAAPIEFPEQMIQICWYILIIGGAIAGTAQTPVVDGKVKD